MATFSTRAGETTPCFRGPSTLCSWPHHNGGGKLQKLPEALATSFTFYRGQVGPFKTADKVATVVDDQIFIIPKGCGERKDLHYSVSTMREGIPYLLGWPSDQAAVAHWYLWVREETTECAFNLEEYSGSIDIVPPTDRDPNACYKLSVIADGAEFKTIATRI